MTDTPISVGARAVLVFGDPRRELWQSLYDLDTRSCKTRPAVKGQRAARTTDPNGVQVLAMQEPYIDATPSGRSSLHPSAS